MRRFIDIVEARRPKAAPIDTSGLPQEITALMGKLARLPCKMRFSRQWADQARDLVKDQVARLRDEDRADFDQQEALRLAVDRLWAVVRSDLTIVRSNIEHETQAYQNRAAERHGYEDDLDNWIEDSGFLRGMEAMKHCAEMLASATPLSDPRQAKSILTQCERFLTVWDDSLHAGDGGEQPILDAEFTFVVERLLPLLLLVYSL